MKIYHSPKIEIEEIEAADIMATSTGTGLKPNETPGVSGGGRPRSVNGSIAGGSTVYNIVNNSVSSNALSVGDIFGNQ